MRAICGSLIEITRVSSDAKRFFSNLLTFPNPAFAKAERMGVWTGNIPRQVILYQMRGEDMLLPFGMLRTVARYSEELGIEMVNQTQHLHEKIDYGCNIAPYDYQQEAIDAAIRWKNGVIVAPCGSGKTQIALAVAAELGLKTLWLTHTQDLMRQSMERAQACFSLSEDEYGTITAGKVNVGKTITFATVQTMSKIDLEPYRDYWDVVIVDECHKCVGTPTSVMMFYKVVNSLNARHKYGITATPKRADGLERCMTALLGDVIHEVPQSAVEGHTCPVQVCVLQTEYKPDMGKVLAADGTISYVKLVTDLTEDVRRQQLIARAVATLVRGGQGATLILSERVAHLQALFDQCRDAGMNPERMRILSAAKSKKSRKERESALHDLNNGEIDIVFATYQLAKEGLDVPNLRVLVLASPQKDRTTVVQSVGRVARKARGKECGFVLDFVDDFGMFRGYAKKRAGYYKKLGYKVL